MVRNKIRRTTAAPAHALRIDRASLVQGTIALVLAFTVAWLFQLP